jgi:predicted lipoprotein with Yx(FWY)xxD motif
MHAHARLFLAAPLLVAGAVALAGCGSSGGGGTAAVGATKASTTVAMRSIGSQSVLTDNAGRTLYVSSQENGSVLCRSGACTGIWRPVTVGAGVTPTGPSAVASHLSTLTRPGGARQVAFDGKPLYLFSLDHGPGDNRGNGVHDSFDGTSFVWHEATPMGAASSAPSKSSSSGGGGYGY